MFAELMKILTLIKRDYVGGAIEPLNDKLRESGWREPDLIDDLEQGVSTYTYEFGPGEGAGEFLCVVSVEDDEVVGIEFVMRMGDADLEHDADNDDDLQTPLDSTH